MQEYKLDLRFESKAKRFLSRCQRKLYFRIIQKLNALKENPFPNDSKRIENQKEKTFRVRIGNYRILYSVFFEEKLIFIEEIDKRSNIYKVKEETKEYSKTLRF